MDAPKQWFVKMEPLAKAAIESVEKGRDQFVLEHFTELPQLDEGVPYDWCISKSLAGETPDPGTFYCDDCGGPLLPGGESRTTPPAPVRQQYFPQDPDTLDAWFSSRSCGLQHSGLASGISAGLEILLPHQHAGHRL